jgi:hypothetical protein
VKPKRISFATYEWRGFKIRRNGRRCFIVERVPGVLHLIAADRFKRLSDAVDHADWLAAAPGSHPPPMHLAHE